MKASFSTLILVSLLLSIDAFAEGSAGIVWLGDHCPGDIQLKPYDELSSRFAPPLVEDDSEEEVAELGGALATAVLGAIVKRGLTTIGEKLKASAQPKTVDRLHSGQGRLFQLERGGSDGASDTKTDLTKLTLLPALRCIIVLSKSTEEPSEKRKDTSAVRLAAMAKGYRALDSYVSPARSNEILTRRKEGDWINDSATSLTAFVEEHYAGKVPGLILVADIVYSKSLDTFRIVPRFVSSDHSIRESRTDTRKRDYSISLSLRSPSAKTPYAVVLKATGLVQGTPWAQLYPTNQVSKLPPVQSSFWLPLLPATPDEMKPLQAAMERIRKLNDSIATHKSIWPRMLEAAALPTRSPRAKGRTFPDSFDQVSISAPSSTCTLDTSMPDGSEVTHKVRVQRANEHLQVLTRVESGLRASIEDSPVKETQFSDLEILQTYKTYWSACRAYYSVLPSLQKATALPDPVGVLDTSVEIAEFRKRPIAEFLAGVLTDATVQTAVANELGTALLDEDVDGQALRTAYEEALVAAEIAMAKSNVKPEDFELAISMQAAQRKANRVAKEQERDLPYPEAGLFSF